MFSQQLSLNARTHKRYQKFIYSTRAREAYPGMGGGGYPPFLPHNKTPPYTLHKQQRFTITSNLLGVHWSDMTVSEWLGWTMITLIIILSSFAPTEGAMMMGF